jgi:hypothetical protein
VVPRQQDDPLRLHALGSLQHLCRFRSPAERSPSRSRTRGASGSVYSPDGQRTPLPRAGATPILCTGSIST